MKADTIDAIREWPADKVARRPIAELIPYARNARTHGPEQVAQLAASIREWGWTMPILVDEEGGIIAGHGRVMAAQKLGIADVPCMVAEGWSEAQKRAYILADNKLALNAGWDEATLAVELADLSPEMQTLTGFSADELVALFNPSEEEDNFYSRKIEAPIYEPTGPKPEISALLDRAKADSLIAEIRAAELPDELRAFLIAAAERHVMFNFRNIAEFYAHSEADVQNLMERSALVIIDFNRAIEEGFVELTEKMCKLADAMPKKK